MTLGKKHLPLPHPQYYTLTEVEFDTAGRRLVGWQPPCEFNQRYTLVLNRLGYAQSFTPIAKAAVGQTMLGAELALGDLAVLLGNHQSFPLRSAALLAC